MGVRTVAHSTRLLRHRVPCRRFHHPRVFGRCALVRHPHGDLRFEDWRRLRQMLATAWPFLLVDWSQHTVAGLTMAVATSPTHTNPTISVVIYAAVYASGKPYQFQ